MRNAFAEEVTRLAEKNKKIVLLSGDIGNKLFERFRKINSRRFYNCGIAEWDFHFEWKHGSGEK